MDTGLTNFSLRKIILHTGMKDNHHIFEERYDWETVTYRFAAESEGRLSGLGQHWCKSRYW